MAAATQHAIYLKQIQKNRTFLVSFCSSGINELSV